MDKDILIRYLQHPATVRCEWSCTVVDASFAINPFDYLAFAEGDLRSDLIHKHFKALFNAKRALDCQAD